MHQILLNRATTEPSRGANSATSGDNFINSLEYEQCRIYKCEALFEADVEPVLNFFYLSLADFRRISWFKKMCALSLSY